MKTTLANLFGLDAETLSETRPRTGTPAATAQASAAVVLDDDDPQRVFESPDGFVVAGRSSAVMIGHDGGVAVHDLPESIPVQRLQDHEQDALRALITRSQDAPKPSVEETMTKLQDLDVAVIVVSETAVELRFGDESGEVVEAIDVDPDDDVAVRQAIYALESKAIDELGLEPDEDGEIEESELDEYESHLVVAIRDWLGRGMTEAEKAPSVTDIRAFDSSVEEGDYEGAFARADLMAEQMGMLDEYRRLRGAALNKFRRSLRVQTPGERSKNRQRRRQYRTNAGMKRRAKQYRKRFKRYLKQSDDRTAKGEDVSEGPLSVSEHVTRFKGEATDEAVRHGLLGFLKESPGPHDYRGLRSSISEAGFRSVKAATDAQVLRVLSGLVSEGVVAYERAKGYRADTRHEAFTHDDEGSDRSGSGRGLPGTAGGNDQTDETGRVVPGGTKLSSAPKNLRAAKGVERCRECRHFNEATSKGHCRLYDYGVGPDQLCDAFDTRSSG